MASSALLTTLCDNPATAALVLAGVCLLYGFAVRRQKGLRDVPGPFWASVTNLYRLWDAWTWQTHLNQRKLHKRYGKLVRYGPRVVSVGDPDAIQDIYGINSKFPKSDFYHVQATVSNGKRVIGMFHARDEALHASFRKPVANAFSMSTMLDYEPLVDSTTRFFLQRLDALYASPPSSSSSSSSSASQICDLGEWLQYYSFDVISEMTFSRRLGFLDAGRDIDGTIASIQRRLAYTSVVGQMPWLDGVLEKNPLIPQFLRGTSYVVRIATAHIHERLRDLASARADHPPTACENANHRDFLAKFIANGRRAPDPAGKLLGWTTSNVFAGSDTTAISLRAVFYYLLKSPPTMAKLRAEVDAHAPLAGECVSWVAAQRMPYLDACIREAMRLHPVSGTILERVVPAGGRVVAGRFLEPGTIVGINPWVAHISQDVYGADAEVWRPERWLEASPDGRRRMEKSFLGFGAGTRTCIGKNISRLEMYKLVPQMLRTFKMELAFPDRDWTVHNAWFVKQSGVLVKLTRRE